MTLDLHKNVLIFLLSSLGLIVLPHFSHLPASLLAFFYLLLGWRFAAIWQTRWLPNKALVSLLTVGGMVLLYSQHQGILGRDAGTALFTSALGLKLMEIKSERDIYLINFLAFVVAASQFLFEQSILMAAYILFVCCVLLATLLCINSGNRHTVPALRNAALLTVQALPIAVVLFVLFPRVEAPRWMLFNDHRARSGLSDTMEPGSISDLALSDELVFRVKFSGALPPPQQRYWRGPVLAHTDGKRWLQASNPALQPLPEKPRFIGVPYRYTLLMEPQNKNWVYALDMAAEYAAPLRQNANYQIITSDNPDKRSEYRLTSFPGYRTGALSVGEYRDGLQLPGQPSAEIRHFVNRLHGFDSPPENFIKQVLRHFTTENFSYTLTPPLMEENPLESFLFDTRRGFCSHYATAFVYLMRVAGIPARVVTGYQGGELNQAGNFLEIRQSDAHAWTEVWLQKQGWVRIDPTAAVAPERIERPIDTAGLAPGQLIRYLSADADSTRLFTWLKQARQLWSNVDYHWQRWIINYDNKNQARFLSFWGVGSLKAMVCWMTGIISVIIALLACHLLYRKRQKADTVLLIYQHFCKKIEKLGIVKSRTEGPRDFAARLKIRLPDYAGEIDRITSAYIDLRYGKHSLPEDLKRFGKQVADFKI